MLSSQQRPPITCHCQYISNIINSTLSAIETPFHAEKMKNELIYKENSVLAREKNYGVSSTWFQLFIL